MNRPHLSNIISIVSKHPFLSIHNNTVVFFTSHPLFSVRENKWVHAFVYDNATMLTLRQFLQQTILAGIPNISSDVLEEYENFFIERTKQHVERDRACLKLKFERKDRDWFFDMCDECYSIAQLI